MPICGDPVGGDKTCQLEAGHIVPCNEDPDGGWITLPTEPYAEIVPRLYQGGTVTRLGEYVDPNEHDFDSVLSLWHRSPFCTSPINERRFPFNDSHGIPAGLSDAVDWVYGQWAVQKKHVLVRCQAGLNRSGLIVALTLVKDGHDPDDAIRLIRERRSPFALCNRFFAEYLQSLA